MHKYGDCSFCSGEVQEKSVELDYRYKGELFIFENVPVGVCQQCGEKHLTAEVAKKVEQRIKSDKKWQRTVSVPVESFSETVYA